MTALKREVGLPGAILLGLGSMLGTGVFVSIAMVEARVGAWVLGAILIAALVALCNALSSAQLAASHAKAGGTYEYGYEYLSPYAGFAAGTMFVAAKSASAATAALAIGALLSKYMWSALPPLIGALGTVALFSLLVLAGLRRSNWANALILTFVVLVLSIFIAWGIAAPMERGEGGTVAVSPASILQGAALIFVAFTGYGRIATLAEEVREPRRFIPPAIAATVAITALLYLGVAIVLAKLSPGGDEVVSLDIMFAPVAPGWLLGLLALAAAVAMAGVLLNLIIGLSRVMLAMGRRGDLPLPLARVDGNEPRVAILVAALVVGALCLLGDVRVAWSFSAVTVLIYYAITNLAALRLPKAERLFQRWIAWVGLGGCLALALFVPPAYWLWALVILALAALWQYLRHLGGVK